MKTMFILVILCIVVSSCAPCVPQPRSVGSISPTTGWSIKPMCGYEDCCGRVDYLYWNDAEIRIEPLNNRPDGLYYKFSQRLYFDIYFVTSSNQNYSFNPSLSYLILDDGTKIPSKGFISTSPAQEDRFKNLDYEKPIRLGSHDNIIGSYKKGNKTFLDPFILVFDHHPPTVSEKFSIQINGFYKNNEEIKIPLIRFAPGVDNP